MAKKSPKAAAKMKALYLNLMQYQRMDVNFRIILDQSYAPGGFILQRARNAAFEDYRAYQNPQAEYDTVLIQFWYGLFFSGIKLWL